MTRSGPSFGIAEGVGGLSGRGPFFRGGYLGFFGHVAFEQGFAEDSSRDGGEKVDQNRGGGIE
jgi:hypothetical protein